MDAPPKPQDPKPAEDPRKLIDPTVNARAKTVKSIKQLKEELGPLSEEVKVEVEEAINEIRTIVKTNRGTLLAEFQRKVV